MPGCCVHMRVVLRAAGTNLQHKKSMPVKSYEHTDTRGACLHDMVCIPNTITDCSHFQVKDTSL